MASSSLQEYPFLTWTSGGNFGSAASLPLLLLFGSGSQLEYFFHLFRFFGKNAYGHKAKNAGVGPGCCCGKKRGDTRYLDKHKRVGLDGFEELTEYVVDERYEISVRLVLRE